MAKGGRVLVTVTLQDLQAQPSGPPLTIQQLAEATGFSVAMIWREIQLGEIASGGKVGPSGRYRTHRIRWEEGRRYAQQLGLIES